MLKDYLIPNLNFVTILSGIFLSFFLFDMLGDALNDVKRSVWIVPVTVLIPLVIWIGPNFFTIKDCKLCKVSWKVRSRLYVEADEVDHSEEEEDDDADDEENDSDGENDNGNEIALP
jgi:hypothetical protein